MEIKIVKEFENPFFNRKDLVLIITHTGTATPKTADVKKELATKYSVHDSQIVVEYIMTKRGLQESDAKVKILNERPPVVEEEKPKEEAPAGEKPSDAAPQPKPEPKPEEKPKAEEPKPEPKEEKKEDEAQTSEAK
jgi:ribosomal protein S24E